jgi:putative PIN family toxin of toxin-antitoxin system
VRAVLDPNVLIAGLLSRAGAPAQLMSRWLGGEFELVVSDRLLDELERAFTYPKLRSRLDEAETGAFLDLLRSGLAEHVEDPDASPTVGSRDPDDDYLIALAATARATLVTGDADLLELANSIPVLSPRAFLDALA